MGPDSSNRREVLKRIGVATTTATLGGLGITGRSTAATTATIADGPWNDYEPWQKDRLDTCNQSGCISPGSTVYVPNPHVFGFDLCVETSAGELCVSMSNQLTSSYYDCAGRELWTESADITKYEYGYIEWSQSVWLGLDSNDCVWIGLQSGAEACRKLGCKAYDPDHTIWDIRYFLDDIAPEIIDFIQDQTNGHPQAGTDTRLILGLLVVGGLLLVRRQAKSIV